MMNKLGFAIKLVSQGAVDPIVYNDGQWTNKVVDIREYLKLFEGLQGTDNVVTFMSFDESGCFLVQLRAISGRVGDFLSGWIYIPNAIEAKGKDIMDAYNFVRKILSQSNLRECNDKIESFFSEEFPKKKYVVQYSPSSGEVFGVRFTDNSYYTMEEILDVDRYQPYYSKYKAIFLLDKDGDVKIAKDQGVKFDDLTERHIEKTCVFNPPSPEDVRLMGKNTKITLKTGQEFNVSILTKKGDKIQLYAIRDGFELIALPIVTIQEDGQTCPIDNPQATKWKKRISSSMFTVYNQQNEEIEKNDVHIFIKGTDVTREDVLISENDCRNITVKITAPDYENYEQNLNLLAGDCEVVLSRKVKRYTTNIVLTNGSIAKMTLESKELPSDVNVSPIKGYDFEDDSRDNRILKMNFWFIWKQRIKGFLSSVIVVALILGYASFNKWSKTHVFKLGLPPWEEIQTPKDKGNRVNSDNGASHSAQGTSPDTAQGTSPDTAQGASLDEAIRYLDDNTTWDKSKMELYRDLQGLFDDMNNFNLDNLLGDWAKKLSKSEQFKKVCESAKKTKSNRWNPKQGIHNPTYNKDGDEIINLTNYINWLDQDQSQQTSTRVNATQDKTVSGNTSTDKNGGL